MNPKAWAGALGAAVVGAMVWGGIGAFLHMELGIVAWGIGALVGIAARAMGSDGQAAGMACAGLALGAILVGKILVVSFGAGGEARKAMEESVSVADFEEMKADAAAYPVEPSDDTLSRYMVDRGYTEAATPEEVTAEERAEFRASTAPMLEDLRRNPLPFEEWRDRQAEKFTEMYLAQYSFVDRIKDSLGVLDIIFILLGVASAYKAASGQQS